MPLNGSGSYTVPNTFVPGTTILSALVNANFSDIATALSTAVYKDGQQTITANIPMSNFKFTGLGSGTAAGDSITVAQVQNSLVGWVVSAGAADAITATYSPAVTGPSDGQLFFFRATAANATTTPTFNPSALGAQTITKSGGTALLPNDIPGNLAECFVRYNSANTRYELLNPAQTAQVPPMPQGRLTPTTGVPVINADAVGVTSVFYAPYVGNACPIWNGTVMTVQTFTQQTLTLVSNHLANTLYDVFAFLNSGAFTIGTGPAWNNSAPGSGARGSGAGTTQLAFQNGFLTNAVSMTARNGATTYTVAANQGTYLGSIYIDATAGQTTCHVGYGQNRKCGVWNAYNRVPILLKAGDSTASWTYNSSTLRASNGAPATWTSTVFNVGSGTSCNGMTTFSGLAEEPVDVRFMQVFDAGGNTTIRIGIGLNSVTAASGLFPVFLNTATDAKQGYGIEYAQSAPVLGLSTFASLESAAALTTFNGTEGNMILLASWRA